MDPSVFDEVKYQLKKGTASSISQYRRDLMIDVLDSDTRCLPILFHIQCVRQCDEILMWLKKNKITGKNLFLFFRDAHQDSPLKFLSFIINEIEKNKDQRPLFYGKDFL